MEKEVKRLRINLRTKFSVASIILALLLSIALTIASYFSYKNSMETRYTEDILSIVNIAANLIDGDSVTGYIDSGSTDEAYDTLQEQFNIIRRESNLEYLYCYQARSDGMYYLVEGEPRDPSEQAPLGFIYGLDYYPQSQIDDAVKFLTDKSMDDVIITDDYYGYLITGYARVYDGDGNAVAVVGADMSMASVRTTLNSYLLLVCILAVVIVVAFIILYLVWLGKSIIDPLQLLVNSAIEFVDTGYDERGALTGTSVDVGTGDEIEDLAKAFNKMTADIVTYISELTNATSERERVQTELRVATLIQMGMLPKEFDIASKFGVELFASMRPAKSVGGDFYDFFPVDRDNFCFVVGDVSDKGVPAALFMAMAKATIKDLVLLDMPLEEVMSKANDTLCKNNDQGMFVTIYAAILNTRTGELTWCDGGHSPAILWKASDSSVSELHGVKGFVVGAFEQLEYTANHTFIEKGDVILQYTDGVSEAINVNEEMYCTERIVAFIEGSGDRDVRALCEGIVTDVDRYAGEQPQFDDITLLSLKYTGSTDTEEQ